MSCYGGAKSLKIRWFPAQSSRKTLSEEPLLQSFDKSGGFSVTETERNHFLNVITLPCITFSLHRHKIDVLHSVVNLGI